MSRSVYPWGIPTSSNRVEDRPAPCDRLDAFRGQKHLLRLPEIEQQIHCNSASGQITIGLQSCHTPKWRYEFD